MLKHKLQFEFTGFKPEYDMHSFISHVAERIHSHAPSDSLMKVVIKKGRDTVQASCRIVSKMGTFMAHTVEYCPKTAIQQIEKTINAQLVEWKKNRFAKGA